MPTPTSTAAGSTSGTRRRRSPWRGSPGCMPRELTARSWRITTRIPFPVMHVDTGHNFAEVLEFRDRRAGQLGLRLIVASVQDSIDAGKVVEESGRWASRNRLQTTTLLDGIAEHRFDAVFGGARRDEEKARAKERIFSFRDEFGQWDPKNQ